MKPFEIYNKNHGNEYCGWVIAETENEAFQKVGKKHPLFKNGTTDLVWNGNQGTYCSPRFGLDENTKHDITTVRKFANVIE